MIRTNHLKSRRLSGRFVVSPVRAALQSTAVCSMLITAATIDGRHVSGSEGGPEDIGRVEKVSGWNGAATAAVRDGVESIDAHPGRIPFVLGVAFDAPSADSTSAVDTATAANDDVTPEPLSEELPVPNASLRRQLLPKADEIIKQLPPPAVQPSDPPRTFPLIPSPGTDSGLPDDLLDLESVSVQPADAGNRHKVTAPWLDIRPRAIGDDEAALVRDDQLPSDTSGLEPPNSVPRLIQLYQADLLMRDIWPGASFCHRPLYFEDQQLERCGSIGTALRHCPSVHSGVHFFWKASSLPISLVVDPPCECVRSGCKPTGILSRLR